MAQYNVSFSCNECGRLHPTKLFLTLSKDFAAGEKLSQVYRGDRLRPKSLNCFGRLPCVPSQETQSSLTIATDCI